MGKAFLDYMNGEKDAELKIHDNLAPLPDRVPVDIFFREPEQFSDLEMTALQMCEGKVLDAGAGAGSMSLYLQESGLEVTALDVLFEAVEVMRKRGVKNPVAGDFFEMSENGFDTVLMLMNGAGIAGDENGLESLLVKAKELINEGGRIIIDSSEMTSEERGDDLDGRVIFTIEYDGMWGEPFSWLFAEPGLLARAARTAGLFSQIVFMGDDGQYLALLKPL